MRLFFAAVLTAAVAAPLAWASPPAGFYESFQLEPAAAFVAGKPIHVWCANSQADWIAQGGKAETFGLAVPGSSELRLAPDVCRYLRAKVVNPNGFGSSLLVLVHEAIHDRGEADEGVTDCSAVHEMPRVAVKFFHVKAGKQLRAVMANAWNLRDRSAPTYRSIC